MEFAHTSPIVRSFGKTQLPVVRKKDTILEKSIEDHMMTGEDLKENQM